MQKPLNVLIWHWGRETGPSKYTLEFVRSLRQNTDLNIVLSCSATSELYDAARAQFAGLPIATIRTFSGPRGTWRSRLSALQGVAVAPLAMLRFRRIVKQHDIDLVVCAQTTIWDVITFPLMMRRKNLRYLSVCHEVMTHLNTSYPLRDQVTLRQIGLTDGIIVLSDHVKCELVDVLHYPRERVWKVPHGAIHFGKKVATAAVHPRNSRPLQLLFFGRIAAYKGIDRLLAALRLLRAHDVPFKLVIAGSGDLTTYSLDEPDIEVHNHWMTEEQVASYIAASDIVVLPYNRSSQSGVAAVAYTAGRPVVAAPAGGLLEQVVRGTTGVLARDTSAEAFAEALCGLICDPEMFDHCAAGALHYANTMLNWNTSAHLFHQAFQEVCSLPRLRWKRAPVRVEIPVGQDVNEYVG